MRAADADHCMQPVLHIWRYYGQPSQTWLYRQLLRMERYPAHIVTRPQWIPAKAASQFPWPSERLHLLPARGGIGARLSKMAAVCRTCSRHAVSGADHGRIRVLCAELGAAAVHVHFGWTATQFLALAPDFGVPVVVSLYGSDVFKARGAYRRRLAALLGRGYPVVVTSRALRTAVVELGAAEARVHIAPVGIDTAMPMPARIRRPARDVLRLVTVGRMVPCKAHVQIPRLARMLRERGLAVHWSVIGDGPLMPQVRQAVREHAVEDLVEFCGALPFAAVAQRLADGDIMVHPAVVAADGSREALGVALMEAGLAGLPVVSCRVGGIPEVVADGETGLLFAGGDIEGIAAGIVRLGTDEALRQRMGDAGRRRVVETFDCRRLSAGLEAVYAGCLKDPTDVENTTDGDGDGG